ncbi:MAG: HAD family hydrolase [Syntrophomonadaceae bacterium]|nr:HAD family hydrolase [Syntrophomonadaceae bacterium]
MPVKLERIECLLFDLDGTLLPMDMEIFTNAYFKQLQTRATPYIAPEYLIKYIWAATKAMQENQEPQLTNQEVFWQHFGQYTEYSREFLETVFNAFYEQEFSSLVNVVQPSPLSSEILDLALAQGKRLVLATNPIFPSVATQERMRWAGIDAYPWQLITTYENSRYCKPHLAYYQDILQQLDLTPEKCLMIGNDVQEDVVASQLGIFTYLVTDCLLDAGSPYYEPHRQGCLKELRDWFAGTNEKVYEK